MKATVLGALAGAGLVLMAMGAFGDRREAFAQWPAAPEQTGAAGRLIALSAPVGETGQLVTVIDPGTRTMCVYHIEKTTGKIAMKGVRNIHWDLQLTYYNNDNPLPREIQALLEPR